MKNPIDFGKRVETGVDPCLPNCPLAESPTTSHCQVETVGAHFVKGGLLLL